MKQRVVLFGIAVFAFLLAPQWSAAQSASHDESSGPSAFTKGSMYLGPHIGLAAYGSSPSFGANFETGVTEPGKVGPGVIGVSARVDYFSWSFDSYDKYTWIALGVFANYHFAVSSKTWDPFLGLGLGYQNVSWSYSGPDLGPYAVGSSYGSGIYLSGTAGARYFFSPNMAARAQLGFGITYLVLGLDFGL